MVGKNAYFGFYALTYGLDFVWFDRLVLQSMQGRLVQKDQIPTKQLSLVTPLETLSRIHLGHRSTFLSSSWLSSR